MIVTEQVIAIEPLTVRRRVRFGECDPAGVAYTARFSEYVVSAMDLFFQELVGGPFPDRFPGIDTPIKALAFVFAAPLRPNDEFDMVVTAGDIREHSFDLHITATRSDGILAFTASVTPICIDPADRRRVGIPAPVRAALESHQRTGTANGSSLPH